MTAEKQSPFLSGGPTRRDRLPVLVGPLVGVLAALVCGISVLTGVVVVHNMQQELTGVKRELSVLQTEDTGLRERRLVENLLDGALTGHDQAVGGSKSGVRKHGDVTSTSETGMQRVKRQAISSSGRFNPSLALDAVFEQLFQQQDEIHQLQTEMAAKDQRILALEQRGYIEHCETGVLATNPYNVLATGSGHRYNFQTANFSRAFRATPAVAIGLVVLDHAHDVNLRVQAAVTDKSTTGLTVRFVAWENAKLYYARVNWIACA